MATFPAFHSATIPHERMLPGIHGLRGIAALAVVAFHLVHLVDIAVPDAFRFIAIDFGKGVHLFFVLSAFSLMHSTEHTLRREKWATEFFVKRFFRIAPLFYCILGAMVLWPVFNGHGITVDWQVLLLNLTFTFGFAPWTSIVWAGWTVGVEMLFYLLLPILLLTVRSSKATLALAAICILISMASNEVLQAHYAHTVALYKYNWAYFSFVPNLCYFSFGMYAFRITRDADKTNAVVMRCVVSGGTSLLFLLLFAGRLNGWQPDIVLWGIGFAALTLWQSQWPSSWCANRIFEYAGERSYSIYLLHPILIIVLKDPLQTLYGMLTPLMGAYAFFICAAAVLLPLLLLSEMTYRLIEKTAIRYGRIVIARMRANREVAA